MKNKVYLDFSVIKVFENKMINPITEYFGYCS